MLAAFEPGDFRYEASQECINNATVMTLRTTSSVVAPLCLQGSIPIATLARLDSFGGIIGLVLPPFVDFLQVFLQNVLLGLG